MRAADLAYRSAVLDVVVIQAQEDLNGAWRSLLSDPVERAAAGMREALPAVAEHYGALAGDRAAIWYEDMRPVDAAKYSPRPFVPKSLSEATGLTTWGVTPLFQGDPDAAWTRLAGTLQRIVSDHDRVTVEENADCDPSAWGWRRRAAADACAYCAYMAVVLDDPSLEIAAMKYHDDCRCVPVMAFNGQAIPEQPNADAWGRVFEKAREELHRDARAARGVRRYQNQWGGWMTEHERPSAFRRRRPDLSMTTKNILYRARRIEPGLFRDGVRSKAA